MLHEWAPRSYVAKRQRAKSSERVILSDANGTPWSDVIIDPKALLYQHLHCERRQFVVPPGSPDQFERLASGDIGLNVDPKRIYTSSGGSLPTLPYFPVFTGYRSTCGYLKSATPIINKSLIPVESLSRVRIESSGAISARTSNVTLIRHWPRMMISANTNSSSNGI